MTLLIQAAQVEFAYGGNQIFNGVSFEIRRGDRLALVGTNGSGKSTLFRLLARVDTPFSGTVTWQRGLTVGYMTQDSYLPEGSTVLDILEQARPSADSLDRQLHELEARMSMPLSDEEMADVLDQYNVTLEALDAQDGAPSSDDSLLEVISGLGLSEDRWSLSVDRLSGGEKKLVSLARFLLEQPDVLLLDEPDNHLDVNAKAWLERFLGGYPGSVGIISHDRYLIDQAANRILELEDGTIRTYPGNYSLFLKQKNERMVKEHEARELQVREVKRIKESSEALTQWARQNPKFASRAENMRRRLEEERVKLEAMPNPNFNRKVMSVEFDNQRGGTLVLEASALEKRFGEREIFRPFDLIVRQGERVGLVGPNGAGKTTLFRMILGQQAVDAGTLRLGASIVPGYYSQEHETLTPEMTPLDYVRKIKALNEQQALSALVEYGFDRTDAMNVSGSLSGGERSRLQILGLILAGANFLLLDEPTNNLDIASTEALEAALLEQAGTMLAISHDRYFLDRVCTRIVDVNDGLVRDYPGGYSFYKDHPDKGTWLTRDYPPREIPVSKKDRRAALRS
ncbi:MAG: ABC-F family ATP-binding cassette domain-containing protein [Thermomicrobiales bacterium]